MAPGFQLNICVNYNTNDENYTTFFGLQHEERIIETARLLNSFSKQFLHGENTPSVDYYRASDANYSAGFQSVVHTVDTLIEWLERAGNNVVANLKKKEAVLRGLLRLTGELTSHSLTGVIERISVIDPLLLQDETYLTHLSMPLRFNLPFTSRTQ